MRTALTVMLLAVMNVPVIAESTVLVKSDAELRAALAAALPGVRIQIAPGRYRPELGARLAGTEQQPIIVEGVDQQDPPLFEGGREALHLSDCAHVILRNITCRGQTDNGVNIDDGGHPDRPSHHVVLDRLHIRETGPQGNHDAIKLSGLDRFVIRSCTTDGWGGQAVDMVGCHHGLIEDCTFLGRAGFSQHTGPQAKGASSDVTIRRCKFIEAGERGVQLGGSTGLDFFRPKGAKFEARNITVEGCWFVGSQSPVTFVGVDGAIVRYNTFFHPSRWIIRILQETTVEGFAPCRNGQFEHNVIVFRSDALRPAVNIGPHTAPETFKFKDNLWFCEDLAAQSRPELPVAEQGGLYGQDPKLKDTARLDFTPTAALAIGYGATAINVPQSSPHR